MEQLGFQFEIISPTQTLVVTVEWIEVESPSGSFLVGPDHAFLVSIIRNKSTITYKKLNQQPTSLSVARGIFKVNANKAIALIDQ